MGSKGCAVGCTCGKHRPRTPAQNRKPKCKSGCTCGKHNRTAEHNERIRQSRLEFEYAKKRGFVPNRLKKKTPPTVIEPVVVKPADGRRITQK